MSKTFKLRLGPLEAMARHIIGCVLRVSYELVQLLVVLSSLNTHRQKCIEEVRGLPCLNRQTVTGTGTETETKIETQTCRIFHGITYASEDPPSKK